MDFTDLEAQKSIPPSRRCSCPGTNKENHQSDYKSKMTTSLPALEKTDSSPVVKSPQWDEPWDLCSIQ